MIVPLKFEYIVDGGVFKSENSVGDESDHTIGFPAPCVQQEPAALSLSHVDIEFIVNGGMFRVITFARLYSSHCPLFDVAFICNLQSPAFTEVLATSAVKLP